VNPELLRLRALAALIATAQTTLEVAQQTLRRSSAALLRTGEATVAELSEATGLGQGELLGLLCRNVPGWESAWNQPGTSGLS
jgi:DsbC/DsbD-like thiol-disulfide interchange protein